MRLRDEGFLDRSGDSKTQDHETGKMIGKALIAYRRSHAARLKRQLGLFRSLIA